MLDAEDLKPLDLQEVVKFHDGQYVQWNITGHIIVHVTPVSGANGVVSGLFLD
jgi:hypothetical protein